ncbi:MAG: LysR family transcriptional regulator [Gemmatimonadota bacterium]|nr:LysR family transcriptional regulator [Gemmatimonadota bacterium]
MNEDLNAMVAFAAVAEARGFRAAGERLGVSASAVSQALRKLEGQLGVTLMQRTTRSVHLTEAGERLYASVRPALEEVRSAVAAVGELGDVPRGTLRLLVGPAADQVLAGPLLAAFLTEHPHVKLDIVVSDAPLDIVEGGFDAGIQLGERIDRDMVAVPVTGDIRMTVVGAPSYFARRSKPRHPRDLVEHDCLNWHPTAQMPPYRWEFTEGGREITVAVPARVLSTDSTIRIHLARAGLGLTIVYEDEVREYVARGELVPVLGEFCQPFPGYYLYYPQRRHASPALRALIDHVRRARRQPARGPKPATRSRGDAEVALPRVRVPGAAKRR